MNRRIAAVLVLALQAAALAAPAQTPDAETAYAEAEALRSGEDGTVDIDRSIVLYRLAAEQGKHAAWYRLGQLQLARGDGAEALDALRRSAEAGSPGAVLLLAEGHAKGAFGAASDPSLGVPELERMAQEPGEVRARLALADLYAEGLGVEADPGKAAILLEEAAASGDARALRALGQAYLDGAIVPQDKERAIALLRNSIEAGAPQAQRDLGLALIEAGRGEEALAVLERAAAEDQPGAAAELANGHYLGLFGAASDKARGARDLEALAEAGDVAAARHALRHHERKSRRIRTLDLPQVLAGLESKTESGDAFAASVLARTYRSLSWLIPNYRARHALLIGGYGHLLSPGARLAEEVWAAYDPRNPAESRERAWQTLDGTPGDGFADGLLQLRAIDQRAYVYALQKEMTAVGAYEGRINGNANRSFIRALLMYCRAEGFGETCSHGPLAYDASVLVSAALEAGRRGRDGGSSASSL